jgi:hypothetical protein
LDGSLNCSRGFLYIVINLVKCRLGNDCNSKHQTMHKKVINFEIIPSDKKTLEDAKDSDVIANR